jgi:competence protein ComEC
MPSPMLVALVAGYVAVVASQLCWDVLPQPWPLLAVVPLALGGLFRPRARRLCAVLIGIGLGLWHVGWAARPVLECRLAKPQEVTLEARVLEIAEDAFGGQRLLFAVAQVPWCSRDYRELRVRLQARYALDAAPGETWRFQARLRPPDATLNPAVLDMERFLFGAGVVAVGSVLDGTQPELLMAAAGLPALRTRLLRALWPLWGEGPGDMASDEATRFARAVLPALLLDDRALLTGEHWRVLANTGTAHLVAISGLHVTLLGGGLMMATALVLRRRSGSLAHAPLPVTGVLVAAVTYAALAGMPVPALRAALMLVLAALAQLYWARAPVWRVLLLVAGLSLLVDPLSVHAAGWWLSFVAVAALVVLAQTDTRTGQGLFAWLLALLRLQFWLWLLMTPLLLAVFGSASSSSLPANLLAGPLVNLLVLPAGLAGCLLAPWLPGVADVPIDAATQLLAWLWHLLAWFDRQAAPWQVDAPLSGLLLAALALLLVLAAVGWRARLLAAGLLALAWPVPTPLPAGTAEVCVLDVGESLLVGVRTSGHALLYHDGKVDGGAGDASLPGGGSLARALRRLKLDAPDLVLDTSGRRLPGSGLLAGPDDAGCAAAPGAGIDGVRLRLLPAGQLCLLQVVAGGHRLLVAGDVRQPDELAAVARWRNLLASDVLVVPRAGSRAASSPTFVVTVAPRLALVSRARHNRYGHPAPDVLRRYRAQGSRVQDTADEGALCMRLGGRGDVPAPVGERHQRGGFWRLQVVGH